MDNSRVITRMIVGRDSPIQNPSCFAFYGSVLTLSHLKQHLKINLQEGEKQANKNCIYKLTARSMCFQWDLFCLTAIGMDTSFSP